VAEATLLNRDIK